MRKIIKLIILLLIILLVILLIRKDNTNKDDESLQTVTIAEVTHSVFYAPQYIAIEKGFFEEEGINPNLILTAGADAVMSAVLSGDADIGLSGSEATIYIYNGGEEDYPMTFAGLTQKDGSFLVSREKIDNFTLEDLKGKYVIGGRIGGMPEMTLEWALKENNIDPEKDLTIDTSIAFSAMEGAFIGGTGDFVTLFEPNATNVEKEGLGYVVAYVGELGGNVPYTAYSAKKSYIESNKEIIKGFSNAINKALKYVYDTPSEKVAEELLTQFPDTSLEDMTTIIERYKTAGAWKENITITDEEWNHIQEIVISANMLEETVSYDKLIYNKYFKDYE